MFATTNVIPFESIQFQTLKNINSSSKKVERCLAMGKKCF
jgi:hypothetical protein